MKVKASVKHLQVDKSQSRMLVMIAASVVIVVFCLVSSKALLSQASYQRNVIHERKEAVKQLKANLEAAKTLETQFNNFEGNDPENIIGGKNTKDKKANPPDGDNARIVLDALPSKYDFPALIASMAHIMTDHKMSGPSIQANDESATVNVQPSGDPKAATINLNISGETTYNHVRALIYDLERSIRPFDITTLTVSGDAAKMSVTINTNTYFQPEKNLEHTYKEVK